MAQFLSKTHGINDMVVETGCIVEKPGEFVRSVVTSVDPQSGIAQINWFKWDPATEPPEATWDLCNNLKVVHTRMQVSSQLGPMSQTYTTAITRQTELTRDMQRKLWHRIYMNESTMYNRLSRLMKAF